MWQFCVSTLRSGLRSRSVQAILVLGLLLVGVAYLASSFSPRHPRTTALDVGFSGMRFSLVLLALFWVQELVGREIERRTIVYALTYPVSRGAYVVGRYGGVLVLLAIAAILLGLLVGLATLAAGGTYEQSFPVSFGLSFVTTVIGLWLDAAVVAAFALWVATLSTVPMLPVALGAAFAIAGKSLGAVIDYLRTEAGDDPLLTQRIAPIIDVVRWVLPDLSRLDWRPWPMYGIVPESGGIEFGILMAAGYTMLLVAFGALYFRRREFA